MKTTSDVSTDLLPAKSTQPVISQLPRSSRRSSLTTVARPTASTNPRRQNLSSIVDAMEKFFQASAAMEDEIMLPSRLRDMVLDELVLDQNTQPENWHEIYTFIRDVRNQLKSTRPFADVNNSKSADEQPMNKFTNDDEGIILLNPDYQHISSASSTASSDDFEQTSSASSVSTSYETLKDELKYHYYGLFESLNQLTVLANRVTEKYREESRF